MFKSILCSLLLFVAGLASAQTCGSTTPNLGFLVPAFDCQNWNTAMNSNWAQVDLFLSGNELLPDLDVISLQVAPGGMNASGVAPGANNQCLVTVSGVATWASCNLSGPQLLAANYNSITVNANTTSIQVLHTVPPLVSGQLNALGKTIHLKWKTTVSSAALAETIQYGIGFNGVGLSSFFDIVQGASATGYTIVVDAWCQTTATGISGAISCYGTELASFVGNPNNIVPIVGGFAGDLTGGLTIDEAVKFSQASGSNTATSQSAPVWQDN